MSGEMKVDGFQDNTRKPVKQQKTAKPVQPEEKWFRQTEKKDSDTGLTVEKIGYCATDGPILKDDTLKQGPNNPDEKTIEERVAKILRRGNILGPKMMMNLTLIQKPAE